MSDTEFKAWHIQIWAKPLGLLKLCLPTALNKPEVESCSYYTRACWLQQPSKLKVTRQAQIKDPLQGIAFSSGLLSSVTLKHQDTLIMTEIFEKKLNQSFDHLAWYTYHIISWLFFHLLLNRTPDTNRNSLFSVILYIFVDHKDDTH